MRVQITLDFRRILRNEFERIILQKFVEVLCVRKSKFVEVQCVRSSLNILTNKNLNKYELH